MEANVCADFLRENIKQISSPMSAPTVSIITSLGEAVRDGTND